MWQSISCDIVYISTGRASTFLHFPVERDLHFDADKTISAYADEARARGHIVT